MARENETADRAHRPPADVAAVGEDGGWASTAYGPEGAAMLATLDLTLSLDAIYEDSGV